ncbi:MAG: hypothetical protein KGO53_11135 [Alphaproteobacteria bacterium]|nr:hypothetical protein [Alphaproteobacteria bacterium]
MPEIKVRDLAAFRQPMVTSLGIIMGFLLNFLAGWATRDDNTSEMKNSADWIVAATLLPALVIMVIVLYRILDIRHKADEVVAIYTTTLRLYMLAIVLAFVGVGAALFF